ncbi:MAG: hypothetical protein KC561_12650 [Myxococcales bacterium]|nr:hypothetical protein [Myxococcales bacterium]
MMNPNKKPKAPNNKLTAARTLMFALFAVLFMALAACGTVDEIDQRLDCNAICDRYQECFDSDYDADACASRCESEGDTDPDYVDRADQCEACIDDLACTESFVCTDECAGIVP